MWVLLFWLGFRGGHLPVVVVVDCVVGVGVCGLDCEAGIAYANFGFRLCNLHVCGDHAD